MPVAKYHRENEAWNVRLVGHTDMQGMGDGMHINLKDGYAFVGHMGNAGTSIVDVRDPTSPTLVGRISAPPNTHSHKVQIVGDIMVINRERLPDVRGGSAAEPWATGLSIYDVSDPVKPKPLSFWSCGGRGVHRMTYWEHPYVYATAGSSEFDEEILAIVDLSDPSRPKEVGRWWYPGMRRDEAAKRTWKSPKRARFHHGIPRNGRLYGGWKDLGLIILDVSDPTAPRLVSRLDIGSVDAPSRNTHTAHPVPNRDLLVVTDEAATHEQWREGDEFYVRLVDIADEKKPKVVSRFPGPKGDFWDRGRFGPHNVHEMRPGSFSDSNLVHVTWFSAGVRIFDISDASNPREVGYYVPKSPPGQPSISLNDIIVDADGLIYVADREAGGLYIFEFTGSRSTS